LLPPSPFNIDDYKRQFFAEKNIAKNIENLFEQVDSNGWSLWIVSYNKSENEGKKIILTNNLMKGFIN
jgi:elongation factor 1-gamma